MTVKTGIAAPEFKLLSDEGKEISLSDFKGKKVVLYFYPKDDTSGCTAEACDFRDHMNRLTAFGAVVLGVSKDNVKSHVKFKDKYSLNFPLLSDETGAVCESYGVWTEKSMYGRKYMGIDRSTFLIGEDGKIAYIWRKVKIPGHVEDILNHIRETVFV